MLSDCIWIYFRWKQQRQNTSIPKCSGAYFPIILFRIFLHAAGGGEEVRPARPLWIYFGIQPMFSAYACVCEHGLSPPSKAILNGKGVERDKKVIPRGKKKVWEKTFAAGAWDGHRPERLNDGDILLCLWATSTSEHKSLPSDVCGWTSVLPKRRL